MIRIFKEVLASKSNQSIAVRLYSIGSSSKDIPTMHEIRNGLKNLIGFDNVWGLSPIDKSSIKHETDPGKLKKHRMKESFAEAIIPLGDEPLLRNRYINFQNSVRFGRLLEDLDTMAVHIAYLHNKSQSIQINGKQISPIVIVTALVDRIEILNNKMDPNKNIKLSGFTSWVGSSSAEVSMKVEQELAERNVWSNVLDAKFLMCARDPGNVGSALMNPLEVGGNHGGAGEEEEEEEKRIFQRGQENKKIRHIETQTSLFKLQPNPSESAIIHDLFKQTIDLQSGSLKPRIKPENAVWMTDTKLKNVLICFPEQRNLYNKIFGGYVMREAFQIAYANACVFSGTLPRICVVDNISFRRPVLIGSMLFMSSQVVYTEDNFMQVKVYAESIDMNSGKKEMTNDFYFKFSVPPNYPLKKVIPKTYSEAMMYIDGKRHL